MTERKASRYLTAGESGTRFGLGRRESVGRPSRSKGKRRREEKGEAWRSEKTSRRRERRGVFEGSTLRGLLRCEDGIGRAVFNGGVNVYS